MEYKYILNLGHMLPTNLGNDFVDMNILLLQKLWKAVNGPGTNAMWEIK